MDTNPFTKRGFNVNTAVRTNTPPPTDETSTMPVKEHGELSDREDKTADAPMPNPLQPQKPTFTNEEILPLLDSLLNNGYAIDKFKIRDTEVILRTRFTWEEQYIYQHLSASNLSTALVYQREFSFITIAASLVKYGNYTFEPINSGENEKLEKSITERYDFIRSLNSVITDILQLRLSKFDDKQRYIIDNFDELLKAF